MFAWYRKAKVCFVFLADKSGHKIAGDAWFERGWTLQELIAPKSMVFFNKSWQNIGTKDSRLDELSKITSVSAQVLSHETPLSSVCLAQRLSWAAKRETTRVEDKAYCLLGILDINMPPLYGEGEKAFYRLQEEVVKSTSDLSILAWSPASPQGMDCCGFFAQSPDDFQACSAMELLPDASLDTDEIVISGKGLVVTTPEYIVVSKKKQSAVQHQYALKLPCKKPGLKGDFYTVTMRKIGPNVFVRTKWAGTDSFKPVPVRFGENERKTFVLLTKIPWAGSPLQSIVSSTRYTQVDIKITGWPPKTRMVEMPLRAWDVQDKAFFGTSTSLQNWGAISFNERLFFVCIWSQARVQEGVKWVFEGFLVDRNSEGMDHVWRDLFLYGETFGFRAGSVRTMLENKQGGDQGGLEFVNSGVSRRITFECRLSMDPAVCRGPRWVVQIETGTVDRV